jgi:hypothetical protein
VLDAQQSRALVALARLVAVPALAGQAATAGAAPRIAPELDRPADDAPDDAVDALIRRHMLAPLAYRAGVARFRRDYLASGLLAELRARCLREVGDALAAERIPVAVIKGAAYAGRIYADPAERPMSDVDLLVPPALHARAERALRRLGFWRVGSPRQQSRLHHAVGYKRKGASIDLHRSIVQPYRSRIDVAALWRRAVPGDDGLWRLDPVDEVVIHLGHVARHELMVPVINYVDAARLLARVDRAAVEERARAFRLGRGVRAALAMTDALTRDARPDTGFDAGPAAVLDVSRRLLPSVDEVVAYGRVWRPLQCLRKALLVDGPRELVGLAAVAVYDGLAQHLRP